MYIFYEYVRPAEFESAIIVWKTSCLPINIKPLLSKYIEYISFLDLLKI